MENLTPATAWMKLEGMVLSEIDQSEAGKYWMMPLIWPIGVKFIETESTVVIARGWGWESNDCLMGTEFQFCKVKTYRAW